MGSQGDKAPPPPMLVAAHAPCSSHEPPSGYELDLAELRAKVETAQARITEFNRQHPQFTALIELAQKLRAAQADHRRIEAAGGVDPDHPPDVQALRRELSDQQEQLAQLGTAEPGVRHPEVVRLQAQIDVARQSLTAATALGHARELEESYRAAAAVERARLAGDRALLEQTESLLLLQESAWLTYQKALDNYCWLTG